jgi:hypothetical protein
LPDGKIVKTPVVLLLSLPLVLASTLLTGCAGSSPKPLNTSNINLIFVSSEDIAYQASGDIDPTTANLTNRGLQRSLLMGQFLKESVLGGANVTSIHALQPMTHLQTANKYPDMAGLQTVQQFALLNQISLPAGSSSAVPGNSFPIYASYSPESVPTTGVAPPILPCPICEGLDFNDIQSKNESMVDGIIQAKAPGYYVLSAPWETVRALMANINSLEGYRLPIPSDYAGPNYVFAISITPAGKATLVTYNSHLNPPSTYPELSVKTDNPCKPPIPFHISVKSAGANIPTGINTNETVYIVRHADAHSIPTWDDGNLVGAGQWRALSLPSALKDKIHPDAVYAVDPSVALPPLSDNAASSYIRPAMTVLPYAIANNSPYKVASEVPFLAQNAPQLATYASDYFFTGGTFSNQKILFGWESAHIPITVNALLVSYQSAQIAPDWSDDDYDSIWTVKIDGQGNLSVDNDLCEGINSADLLKTPPPFGSQ